MPLLPGAPGAWCGGASPSDPTVDHTRGITLDAILSEVRVLKDGQADLKGNVAAMAQEQESLIKAVLSMRDDISGIARSIRVEHMASTSSHHHRTTTTEQSGGILTKGEGTLMLSDSGQALWRHEDNDQLMEASEQSLDAESMQQLSAIGTTRSMSDPDTGSMELGEHLSRDVSMHICWEPRVESTPGRFATTSVNVFARSTHADTERAGGNVAKDEKKPLHRWPSKITETKKEKDLRWYDQITLPPSSDFLLVWNLGEGLLLSYDIFSIPASVFEPKESDFTVAMIFISLIFWTADMPVCFLKSYLTSPNGDIERRLRKVVKHYLSRDFLMDISLLCIEYVNFILWFHTRDDEDRDGDWLPFIRMLRFSRLLKVQKMRRVARRCFAGVKSPENLAIIQNSGHLILLMLLAHAGACIFYSLGDRWREEADLDGEHFEVKYFTSLQWSIAQFGFGAADIYPIDFQERLVSVLFSMACLIAFCLWLASLIASLIRLQVINKEDRQNKEALRAYLQEHRISWALRTRAMKIVEEVSERKQAARVHEGEVKYLSMLPKTLNFELRAEAFIPIITTYPFFGVYGISQADRHAIISLLKSQESFKETAYEEEQEIFTEREPGRFMFFVVDGRVVYRWRRLVEEVHDYGWLSEASLWLRWRHVGQAFAKTDCELLLLDADAFRRIMQGDLPEASLYAKSFHKYVSNNSSEMNDLFPDPSIVGELALDVFEPPKEFKLAPCYPQETEAGDEWSPADRAEWHRLWMSPWTDSCLMSSFALIQTLTSEMKSDAILVYQTLFSQALDETRFPWGSELERELFDSRVCFLKRLFLCLSIAGVEFTDVDNGTVPSPWPFPLAAILCHGGRITARLEDVQASDLLNLLLTGNKDSGAWRAENPPQPFYTRHAATHGVFLEMDSKHLQEVRRRGTAALSKGHYGLDLPTGGLANPTPQVEFGDLRVGPSGVPFKYSSGAQTPRNKELNYLTEYQHGHLYLRHDDFGRNSVRTLIQEETGKPISNVSGIQKYKSEKMHYSERTDGSDVNEFRMGRTRQLQHFSSYSEIMANLAVGKDRLRRLEKYTDHLKELRLIEHSDESVECRGFMIRLMLCMKGDRHNDRVLKQVAAHAEPYGSEDGEGRSASFATASEAPGHARAGRGPRRYSSIMMQDSIIEEAGYITVICRVDESWLTALTRHLRTVFKLHETVVKQILDGCQEESYLHNSGAIPSFCFHHMEVCGSDLKLEYDVIFLQSVLSVRDVQRNFPKNMAGAQFTSVEEGVELQGFNGEMLARQGRISRQWVWAERSSSSRLPIPSTALPLKVLVRDVHISSLLFGMESSAPMLKDLYGTEHNMAAQSKSISALGKRKWRDYRHLSTPVPADMGGVTALITPDVVSELQQVLEKLSLSKPSEITSADDAKEERDLFKALLQSSDALLGTILLTHLGITRPKNRLFPEGQRE